MSNTSESSNERSFEDVSIKSDGRLENTLVVIQGGKNLGKVQSIVWSFAVGDLGPTCEIKTIMTKAELHAALEDTTIKYRLVEDIVSEALTNTEIVNKFAAVDTQFAVSSKNHSAQQQIVNTKSDTLNEIGRCLNIDKPILAALVFDIRQELKKYPDASEQSALDAALLFARMGYTRSEIPRCVGTAVGLSHLSDKNIESAVNAIDAVVKEAKTSLTGAVSESS